jgi:hypothetical protein
MELSAADSYFFSWNQNSLPSALSLLCSLKYTDHISYQCRLIVNLQLVEGYKFNPCGKAPGEKKEIF